ncbi:pyridoxal phosphate-dependent aminotransferase [Haliangium ochraceum]|uniref:Aminotransferase n=1 Tax=Haliangium ochraceum (strain DSM 14365 / JCM 11303 / SMP-2) TaxID=502025 RepID=D0LU93_HALO1|nr:pyridoxal phosphate-dependent aminotransferase [Haliangium ochraceum]ACY17457.1 aminotransferase class I and II [Haliangium ochraceum DSM 14365]
MSATLRLSSRLDAVKPSITMAVTAQAQELRAQGIDVIGFGAGEPDFATPSHIRAAVKEALDRDASTIGKYTPAPGLPALRAAVANELSEVHGGAYTPAQVIVTCGAKHALYELFQAMLDPGDEVIVPAPYWVSYPDMVRLAGGTPVVVDTRADERFLMAAEDLRAAITPRTRAILLNTPSNPTGAVYDRARLEALAAVVLEHDLFVISDDIYRHLVYDGHYESIAGLSPEVAARTVLIDGVSKSYAMTGWRIGYALGPLPLIQAMGKIQSQLTSGASHVAQVAALAALTGPQACIADMRVAFDGRRREMHRRLSEIPGVRCVEPEGAFYCFPDISSYIGKQTVEGTVLPNDVALCAYLVREGKVAIVPGSGFGAPGYARLSYACSMDDIRTGVTRMAEALSKLS